MPSLTAREIEDRDILALASYWTNADEAFLRGMGADPALIPTLAEWVVRLKEQIDLPYPEKKSYCIIWEIDGEASGHCNVNNIEFGKQAHMHLHLWKPLNRNHGAGTELVKQSLPHFFKNLQLQKLICEPSSFNAAPNKTLQKLGFQKTGSRVCVPGMICFEQEVSTWVLERDDFERLLAANLLHGT